MIATDAAGNASDAQSVTLDINDLDDVAPTITSGVTAVAIDENSGAGQVIYTVTSTDLGDDVADTPIAYSLAEGSDAALSIDASTGAVTLATDPNHEMQSQYSFAVIATDGAGNESAAHPVNLDINNLDEVAPTILSTGSVSVLESAGANASVYRALADDTADISAQVTFSLSEDSDAALTINSETGVVTLNEEPIYNPDGDLNTYIFTVIADDGVNQSQKAVTLEVVDEDLVVPVFISTTSAVVNENIGENQIIYTAVTEDESLVQYSLSEDSDAALSINSDTGQVSLSANPDHEIQTVYSFTVIATDSEDNSFQQAVTVTINDLDDAAPTITSGATAASVDENSGASQVIYTVVANDLGDDVADTPITYSLVEGSDAALSINATTGAVTLTTDPDHELQTQYSFAVTVTDGAGNASEEQSVTLDINNLDDTVPVISSSQIVSTIDENSGSAQVIYNAIATDSGDGTDGNVNYSLAEGSDADLAINSATGAVILIANPDHETQNQYSFTVIATDSAGNSSEQALTLNVSDLDEIAPTFTSLDVAMVSENIIQDSVVYRSLVDDSADISAGITFSLKEGSDAALDVDASTGVVTINEVPDFEAKFIYSFTVVASDGVNSSEQAVTLTINNLDEIAPTITSGSPEESLDENSGAGQIIYRATSDDSGDISLGVSYSLVDDLEGALSIDATTGEVILTTDPDHEVQSQYSFAVIATDAAGNASDAQSVTLDINDLDEAAPTFTSGDTAVAIDENSGANQVVYTASADDTADVSDGFTFSLAEDSDAGLSIDENTGAVTLADNPDHETKSEYSFTVVATDNAGNASSQLVSLSINDLDDAAPTVNSSAAVDAIEENSGAGQVIYIATADDSTDDISDTPIAFSLTDDSDAALTIDSVSGEVSLIIEPVYFDKSAYNFAVVATDAAGNASDPQALVLNIIETLPPAASVSLNEDTGVASDNISSNGEIAVSGLKAGASWEYSLDNGVTWSNGTGSSFTIDGDGTYQVNVRQTNTAGSTEMAEAVEFSVDTTAPIAQFVSADSDPLVQAISVNYSEALDSDYLPNASDYVIEQNGNPLTVSAVSLNPEDSSILVLSINESFNSGALNFTYNASENAIELVTDLAGNQLVDGFTQMIVSDGYIRGAQVYIDVNGDGIADESELREEVTSDAFGQIILTDEFLSAAENIDSNGNPYQVIVKGGVNMDSGAPNEIELTAPAGYSVINPLSTLVQQVVSSGQSLEEAESSLGETLGIEIGEGGFGDYDPQSDVGENALANRVIATQIATVLSVASTSEVTGSEGQSAESEALQGLVNVITSAGEGVSVSLDSDTLGEVLVDVVNADELIMISTAIDAMEVVKNLDQNDIDFNLDAAFAGIVQAQADAIDTVAPQAPEPDVGCRI